MLASLIYNYHVLGNVYTNSLLNPPFVSHPHTRCTPPTPPPPSSSSLPLSLSPPPPLPLPPLPSQLPPVVQNMAFQKYSNMEQSLFTRFVRLRVPTVQLDAQGRARPSLCELYNWRYSSYNSFNA